MAEGPSSRHRLLTTHVMRRETVPVRTKPAYRSPPAVGAKLRPVVARLHGAKTPGHAGLMLHWSEIVGPELAAVTEPGTLKAGRGLVNNGVLTIRVAGPVALELQHQEAQILERINTFLGYRAAGRLKLVQGPLELPRTSHRSGRSEAANPSPEEVARSADLAANVSDGELRALLARLGARILAERGQEG